MRSAIDPYIDIFSLYVDICVRVYACVRVSVNIDLNNAGKHRYFSSNICFNIDCIGTYCVAIVFLSIISNDGHTQNMWILFAI